jgi:hypothetical protein
MVLDYIAEKAIQLATEPGDIDKATFLARREEARALAKEFGYAYDASIVPDETVEAILALARDIREHPSKMLRELDLAVEIISKYRRVLRERVNEQVLHS